MAQALSRAKMALRPLQGISECASLGFKGIIVSSALKITFC